MFYAGIDIAKYRHEATVIDSAGKALLDSMSFTNSKEGREKLLGRFDTPCRLVAFAGLDVKVTQSGEFSGTRQKISKRGSPHLRRAIWLAASREAFCDPTFFQYYQGLRARGKHHLTAVGAVARKLGNINFVILRDNRPYEPCPSNFVRPFSAQSTM